MFIAAIEKIEFILFGLDLLEPNSFITDILLGILSIYFGLKLTRSAPDQSFYKYWKWFLLLFGLSAILGGIGHTFYNYLGIAGKIPAWLLGTIAVYYIEGSMIYIHPNKSSIETMHRFSKLKFFIIVLLFLIVVMFGNPTYKEQLCILFVVLNSLIGVSLTAGGLGLYYYRLKLSKNYRYLVIGVLIMIPSSIVFLFNLNLSQWFDKNDLSHVILGTGIAFFYTGLSRLSHQESAVKYFYKLEKK